MNGHNVVDAGVGDDKVKLGAGNDALAGGDGNDNLNAVPGKNAIDGGDGNDVIKGSQLGEVITNIENALDQIPAGSNERIRDILDRVRSLLESHPDEVGLVRLVERIESLIGE